MKLQGTISKMHFAEEQFVFCRIVAAAAATNVCTIFRFVSVFAIRIANVYHHLFIQFQVEFSFEL